MCDAQIKIFRLFSGFLSLLFLLFSFLLGRLSAEGQADALAASKGRKADDFAGDGKGEIAEP